MAVLSGIKGRVGKNTGAVHNVGAWSISESVDDVSAVTTATKAGTARRNGNKDWSGSYSARGHTPAVKPGETFTFKGSLDAVKGCSGDAICDDVEIEIDIESGAIIQHTVNFSANGVLTRGAQAAYADSTVPDFPTSVGVMVGITPINVGSPTETLLAEVRTVRIRLSRGNNEFVGSGVAGQKRRTKGNFDAELAITCYTDDVSALPAPNSAYQVNVYVDAADDEVFWLFQWMRFQETGDYGADIEGASNIQASITARMSGYEMVGSGAGTATEGKIDDPSGATIWPEA